MKQNILGQNLFLSFVKVIMMNEDYFTKQKKQNYLVNFVMDENLMLLKVVVDKNFKVILVTKSIFNLLVTKKQV